MKIFLSKKTKNYLLISIIFAILTYWQVIFLNKSFQSISINKVLEGTNEINYGKNAQELTVMDPGGYSWIDLPLSQVNKYKIKHRKLPLWNEFSGGGQPLFFNQTSQALSLLRYIFPLNLFPNAVMWDIFTIFRFFLFSIFFYLFLRKIGISKLTSVGIALYSSINGYFMLYLNLFHLDVEVTIPLYLLGIESLIQNGNAWFLPLSVFLLITGGNIQSTIIALIFGTIYFLIRIFLSSQKKLKMLFNYMVYIFLGFGLSLFYIIPFYVYFINSFHVHSPETGKMFYPLTTITGFLTPFSLGPIHSLWSNFSQHFFPNYIGIIPILIIISFFSLFHLKKSQKSTFIAFFLITLLFIAKLYNKQFSYLIGSLPLLNKIVFPKYSFPLYFSIFVLLALIIDNLNRISLIKKIKLITAFFIILFIHLFLIRQILKVEIDPSLKYFKLRYIFYNNATQYFLSVIFLFGILILGSFNKISKNLTKIFLISLICLENIINANLLIEKKSQRYDIFKNPAKYVRFLIEKKTEKNYPFRIYGTDRVFFSQLPAGFLIEDLRTLDALTVSNHIEFMRNFITGNNTEDYLFYSGGKNFLNTKSIKFLEMTNVKYLLTLKGSANESLLKKLNYNVVYEDNPIIIFELKPLSRAYIPNKIIVVNKKEKIKEKMKNNDFDPLSTVIIYDQSYQGKSFLNCNYKNDLRIIEYSGDKIKIKTNIKCENSFIVVTNTYFPGWEAYSTNNGQKIPIKLANLTFIGIPVKKGEDIITLTFSPSYFKRGVIISSFCLIIYFIYIKIKMKYL